MKADLIISGGTIVTETLQYVGNIAVKDEKIIMIFTQPMEMEAKMQINAEGMYVIPGGIQMHASEESSESMLYESLKALKESGGFLCVHAESEELAAFYTEQLKKEGKHGIFVNANFRSEIAELEAVERTLFWVRKMGGSIHFCRVASAAALERIAEAKREGLSVTAETCPQYLFFTRDDLAKKGITLKCTPPVRDEKNRCALWDQIKKGNVDCIASDHWLPAEDVPHMLAVLLTLGVQEYGISLKDIVKLFSANPARRLGIYGKKGTIQIGADADLVLLDLNEKWIMKKENCLYENKISPYLGYEFTGKVKKTILRGRLAYDDAVWVDAEGSGTKII